MLDYLTRNLEILAEAKQVVQPIKLGSQVVGEGSRNWFVPCGSFQSTTQGQLVHVGIKFSDSQESMMEGFYTALTNLAFIAQMHPELSHQLPLFYGLVVSPANKPKAVITQDFSLGGQHEVKEYRQFGHANVPDGLVDLFDPFGRDMIQLERAIFYVNGERKIGDLNHLNPKDNHKQERDKIQKRIASGDYTIPFTRVPLEQLFQDEAERRYASLVLEACKGGSKEHERVLHVDPEYRINISSQLNRILTELVDNFYLDSWRNQSSPVKTKVFALAE